MGRILWTPSEERTSNANLKGYSAFLRRGKGLDFGSYGDLHQWSVEERAAFWESLWNFFGVIASRQPDTILENPGDMLESKWFNGARLNFAQNLLRYKDDRTAIVFKGEASPPVRMTYAELHAEVAALAHSLRAMGVKVGDRIAGFMPNMVETVVAMLAATCIGAIWSSTSPDFGAKGVCERFGQIDPKVLFTADGYSYNGKLFHSLDRVRDVVQEINSLERVVVVPYISKDPEVSSIPNAVLYRQFLSKQQQWEITFEQLPFDHPVYILFSSGTTGVPKCIVHGAGGTLLQHMKEHALHTDMKRDDVVFYFTTSSWMMWNWLVSSLAIGATIVLFDGSPFYPDPGALFRLAEEEGMTVFGTSAKYLSAVEKEGLSPGKMYDLSPLKTILSTGSPLSVESFNYVYSDIKEDVHLASITGGTDIISCFALGNPMAPVWEGELQCRGLGMKVDVLDDQGKSLRQEKGELVCTASFPSQPLCFWNDPKKQKYQAAYFDVYPNVWKHGDFAEITEHDGVIIYGRSDATLKPGGVRIGTAEIYRVLENMEEVVDSVVVGQKWEDDERIVLFVRLAEGKTLDGDLVNKIKKRIRLDCTPRHVPSKVIAVPDIPYTISGKKVELAVRRVIDGEEVGNLDALANPESLEHYGDLEELRW